MKRRAFSRRTFIKTLGAISLPSIDPRVLKSQWLTGAGDSLKSLRKRIVLGNEKFGLINKAGDFILPPVYDSWLFFREGLADTKLKGKTGYIDLAGKWVIPPVFEGCGSFEDGLAYLVVDHKFGFINRTGEIVIPPKYEVIWKFFEELLSPI
jgi:hypothetical protein